MNSQYVLGANNYGKAEIRLVRIDRDGPEHRLADLNVSVSLSGDFAATHVSGDNTAVLPTDTQKNTVFAFAQRCGIDRIEDFGLALAEHFVTSSSAVHAARVSLAEFGWRRLDRHSFARAPELIRTAVVTVDDAGPAVRSGLRDLALLKTVDSEFTGFVRDGYTTLAESTDRILATVVNASWSHDRYPTDWNASFGSAREALITSFVDTYSRSLQQTLYAMGTAVLAGQTDIREVRLSLPNQHHFLVDLTPFGQPNLGQVYHPTDRPYGLIEATVVRPADAPVPGMGGVPVG